MQVLVLVGTIAGLLWWNTANGIPGCAQAGYNNNSACPPYGAEVGWYSYCYVSNGRWIASPYRCGLIDPANGKSLTKLDNFVSSSPT